MNLYHFINKILRLRGVLYVPFIGAFVYQLSRPTSVSLIENILIEGRRRNSVLSKFVGDGLGIILIIASVTCFRQILHIMKNPHRLFEELSDEFIDALLKLPSVSKQLDKERIKLEESLEKDFKGRSRELVDEHYKVLPTQGVDGIALIEKLRLLKGENDIWKDGRVSGQVYHGKNEHQSYLNEVFSLYSLSNPLHGHTWPSVIKFESEIVSMTATLMNGSYGNDPTKKQHPNIISTVCGCTSSGGTESILLAIKSHRDFYCKHLFGITNPEIVCCTSAHAAVDKACELLKIRLIKVPMTPDTFQCDTRALARAITRNTIMIYASAPGFPQGVIDPIEEMGRLALKFDIGLHVDCCLGGFILPFARKMGYDIPAFDFTVPGVTSMSVDTHKYGYSLKGTSVVLYRTPELRHAQYFCYPNWTGGLYTTPSIAGSRSGGLIAQCWASMVIMGEQGYTDCARQILETTRTIAADIKSISGLQLMVEPKAMIVCFGIDCKELQKLLEDRDKEVTSDLIPSKNSVKQRRDKTRTTLLVYNIVDKMSKLGWSLNSLQSPPCAHFCITMCQVGKEKLFISDLSTATKVVLKEFMDNSQNMNTGTAAIYGMSSTLPAGPIKELLKTYNDVVLKV